MEIGIEKCTVGSPYYVIINILSYPKYSVLLINFFLFNP